MKSIPLVGPASAGRRGSAVLAALGLVSCLALSAAERSEHFDADPGWEGRNHRATRPEVRTIRQDFGYSATAHAGGQRGEIGGWITPAAEPAYYARPLAARNLDRPLSASGKFAAAGREFHVLLGYFNADTVGEWRTPNSLALRLLGRGERFLAYVEYATSRWRAGGDDPVPFPTERDQRSGRDEPRGFASGGTVHRWSLRYDPAAAGGQGAITATIDDATAVCHLAAEHRLDGATFNRFGLLNIVKSADGGGEVWLDDLIVDEQREDFSRDPGWEARGNRRTYPSSGVRPRFDFGFSPTQFAGGLKPGELGGILYRGDCREAERLACYADRVGPLSLERPLRASGTVALRRGVSDSGVLLGFFDSRQSMTPNPAQDTGLPKRFFGLTTDAPSREGFWLAPVYRLDGDHRGQSVAGKPLYLLPDGRPHRWSFEYDPAGAAGRGQIVVSLDDRSLTMPLGEGHKSAGTRLDRFGLITPWIDGNSQTIYFDDLTYTASQP